MAAAAAAAAVVLVAAFAWPEGARHSRDNSSLQFASWAGPLSSPQLITRFVAIVLLVVAVTAGRLGVDDQLENLAPALVVGAGWPLLVLASVSLGRVWRWTDPWDAGARALARGQTVAPPRHVWPAVPVAVGWVWYLSAYADPLDPRSVGAILAVYTLVTIAGCLAFGRAEWLGSAEPLGIMLSWMARLPRGRLVEWDPPQGAEALLGALAGGVLFGALRRSELWGGLNTVEHATVVATVGLLVSCAAFVALFMLMALSAAEPAVDAAATRAAVPAVAGIILAVALDRNRLFTSVQLLPELLGDPLGRGWDPFGWADASLNAAPLGRTGLLAAQLALLVVGPIVGGLVVARRVRRRARGPVALGLSLLTGASVIAVVTH